MTRKLYLIRHGDALPTDEETILLDEDRPLSPLGLAQAASLGNYLRLKGTGISEVVTSPLVRARQTAAGLLAGLGLDEPRLILCDELAPGGRVKRLGNFLERLDANDLAVVGHQPDLAELLGWLVGSRKAQVSLSKGGVACVRVESPEVAKGCGELVWLMTPAWYMPPASGGPA